jgi:hypothetical protein
VEADGVLRHSGAVQEPGALSKDSGDSRAALHGTAGEGDDAIGERLEAIAVAPVGVGFRASVTSTKLALAPYSFATPMPKYAVLSSRVSRITESLTLVIKWSSFNVDR